MRTLKLVALGLVCLGLSGPASAQRFGLSIGSSGASAHVSVGARIGHTSVHLGYGNRGYVSSRRCAPARVWVPGHYTTVYERVWIPGCTERRWIDPVVETRYDTCGRAYQVVVRPGRWEWVEVPGYYESRPVQQWIPGCWQYSS